MTSISAFSKLRDVTLPLLLYLLHRAHCYASNSNYKWCLLGKLWELWGRLGGLNHVWFCYAISFPSWESLQGTDPRKKPKSILESIIMNPVVTKITAVLWLLVLGSPQGCPIFFWSLLPCWLAWWQHWFSKCDYWTSSTIWGLATSPPHQKKKKKKIKQSLRPTSGGTRTLKSETLWMGLCMNLPSKWLWYTDLRATCHCFLLLL